MPAVIPQSNLARALQAVGPVVGRAQVSAIAAIRLDARGDELVVSASTRDASIRHVETLQSPAVGTAIVPAAALQRFVGAVSGAVSLELRADRIVAAAENVRVELHTLSADGWIAPAEPEGTEVVLTPDDVVRVRSVAHAAAHPAANPTLAGIRLEPGWAVALDGYRLAAARLATDPPPCVIPIEVATSGFSAHHEVVLVTDGQRVQLSSGPTTSVTTTVAGTYPDWRLPLPDKSSLTHRLVAQRTELVTALRRAESLGFKAGGMTFTRVELTPRHDDTISVRSADAAVGESEEAVTGTLTLPRIAFNARYLRDALQHAGQRVELQLSEGTRPAVLDQGNHLELVMPIRS